MLATSKQNFFSQKFCTGCSFRINISNKKTILQQAIPKLSGGMLNPKLTCSLTQTLIAGRHAVMRQVISCCKCTFAYVSNYLLR